MYTRKQQFAGMAILPLFFALSLTATPASSQNYHHKVVTPAQASVLDSMQSDRLQVAIRQTNAGELRFRISILNPNVHQMTISVQRGRDVLFEDLTNKPNYDNIFNFSDLEDGEYVILVNNGKEKVSRNIRIQTETKVDRQVVID